MEAIILDISPVEGCRMVPHGEESIKYQHIDLKRIEDAFTQKCSNFLGSQHIEMYSEAVRTISPMVINSIMYVGTATRGHRESSLCIGLL
jgi:hypothetical protein